MSETYYTNDSKPIGNCFDQFTTNLIYISVFLIPSMMLCCSTFFLVNGTIYSAALVPKNCKMNTISYSDTPTCLYAKMSVSIIETPRNKPYLIEQCVSNYFSSTNISCYRTVGYNDVYIYNISLIMVAIIFYIGGIIMFLVGLISLIIPLIVIKKSRM